jgi:uncharacterized membrane protein YbhN (UPF0104 family)
VFLWTSQILLVAVLGVLIWRALAAQWSDVRALDLSVEIRPALLAAAALVVLGTYGLLIAAWRRVVVGWGFALPVRAAVRIWTLSNLGRYLPGKVWSVAGLVVLARRAGVEGWAAAGAAVAMQAMALGTAATVAAVAVPQALTLWQVLAAIGLTAGTLVVLVSPRTMGWLDRMRGAAEPLRHLPVRTALTATAVTALSWLAYGLAFWVLAEAILPGASLPWRAAVGVFTVGYVAGLLAVFAPGGVGVREAVFVAMLAPTTGTGGAIALAAASRLLLTLTELVAAGVGALATGGAPSPDESTSTPG